jgi:hypothetical protein
MSRIRPAVRIVFAPIAFRGRKKKDPAEHIHGEADKANRTIRIDPRLPEIGSTLLHELTHVRHPDWSEEKVTAYEHIRWSKMGWRQKARLLQLLGSAKLEGE